MITTKEELAYYLKCDKVALKIPDHQRKPKFMRDEIWRFQISLRNLEYYSRKTSLFGKIIYAFRRIKHHRLAVKCGFSIPINVFGPGLSIAHLGTIVVNSNARVGCNCRIQEGVNIGSTNGSSKAPQIGDNCFLGSGAKVIGDITIANNVAIGAGAVVVKDCLESNVSLGGVPARIISTKGSGANVILANEIVSNH